MKLYAVVPFSSVLVSTCSPSLNNLIVIVGCTVPSGAIHVFVPLTLTFSCSIVFVKLYPSFTDVYPSTSNSATV